MSISTAPDRTGNGAPGATTVSTSPMTADAGRMATPDALAAVTSAVATQYYAELVPIPAASPRLWLFADNAWRALSGASALQFEIVQQAFLGSGSAVTVWYDGSVVVGLVVSGN
ncbi:hypothetical protein [Pseudonocardia sp.]|uniref:hypothetical protein n=1 Tax=Pseudonocardia sp. TaxID=60912 RepID=UPI003D13CBDB